MLKVGIIHILGALGERERGHGQKNTWWNPSRVGVLSSHSIRLQYKPGGRHLDVSWSSFLKGSSRTSILLIPLCQRVHEDALAFKGFLNRCREVFANWDLNGLLMRMTCGVAHGHKEGRLLPVAENTSLLAAASEPVGCRQRSQRTLVLPGLPIVEALSI